jgi:hypothetical protein
MGLVVDAQIVKGFFQESVLGAPHDLSGSLLPIFDPRICTHCIYVDNEGTIQYEWRSVVDPDWFDVWFAELIRDGSIAEIAALSDVALKKQLKALGFPATGRDIWYARVGCAVSGRIGFSVLISEDLDFYEPKTKGCGSKRRRNILYSEAGAVRRYLRKKRAVIVKSVERFVAEYPKFLAD